MLLIKYVLLVAGLFGLGWSAALVLLDLRRREEQRRQLAAAPPPSTAPSPRRCRRSAGGALGVKPRSASSSFSMA